MKEKRPSGWQFDIQEESFKKKKKKRGMLFPLQTIKGAIHQRNQKACIRFAPRPRVQKRLSTQRDKETRMGGSVGDLLKLEGQEDGR